MKLFNNHSGLGGLPCFTEGVHWATGSSLTTPFTEECPGVNDKASPPGRHQEQARKQRCTFRPTAFSSFQWDHKGSPHAVTDLPGTPEDLVSTSIGVLDVGVHA